MQRVRRLCRVLPSFRYCSIGKTSGGATAVIYDAVIVGASIAGLSTGVHLAKAGWKICLVDRRREIGVPVRCGEATGNRAELARFVEIDESWIAGDIAGLAVHAGKNFVHRTPVPGAGVMLHRDRFEKSLWEKADALGAVTLLGTTVTGLVRSSGGRSGVTLDNGNNPEATYIIDAGGVESNVGRWAGLTKKLALDEVASAMQYRVKSGFCNDGFLHFFIGAAAIPCGYLWVFPKSPEEILVGGALYRSRPGQPRVKEYVDRFLAEHVPDAPPYKETMITGGIPVTVSPKKLVKENIVIVGDAARQANPLTAGGIMNALEAADSASRYLLARGRNAANRVPDSYSATWKRNQRRQHTFFMLVREIWFSTPEAAIVPRLRLAFSLAGKALDRSRPFRLPVVAAVRFLAGVLPLTIKNIRVLFK